MAQVESESRFVLRQLKFLLMLPLTLIKIIFRRKKSDDLFKPLSEFKTFIFQPKMTCILILLNVLIFIAEVFIIPQSMFESLVFKPENLWSFNLLPIVASWFLHASLAHLLGNMLFLYIFGRIIELHFGSAKFFLIYFGSVIVSDIISAIVGQGGIGASGAIAGLISAAILIDPFYFTYLVVGIPLPILFIGWLAIFADLQGVLYPTSDNIGHFAHLGGYIAISLLVFLFNKSERKKMKRGLFINILFVIAYIIVGMFL